jgi:anti-sigma factor RsiW
LAHCAEITPLLSAFKDGELPPLEHDQVTLHLENCLTCRDTLLDFVLLGHHLKSAVAMPSLEGFVDGVLDAIGEGRRPLGQRLRFRLDELRDRWVAGVALAGVAIATASLVLVLAEPPSVTTISGIVHRAAAPTELAQNDQSARAMKVSSSATHAAAPSDQNSQTYISRLESRHPAVATWSEPDYKTTVIWLGDDNSGNE